MLTKNDILTADKLLNLAKKMHPVPRWMECLVTTAADKEHERVSKRYFTIEGQRTQDRHDAIQAQRILIGGIGYSMRDGIGVVEDSIRDSIVKQVEEMIEIRTRSMFIPEVKHSQKRKPATRGAFGKCKHGGLR